MSNISQQEIEKMKHLIGYGKIDENASRTNNKPIVEFHSKGADGRTYGIIREFNKFYIKVAPKKDTEVVAEDYSYIGGINNKKDYEYSTYALAAKQFDLKMKSLNEAYANVRPMINEQAKKDNTSEWQVNETKEMRGEIERFNQIVNNVQAILSEDKKGFTMAHTLPEAPAKNPSTDKVNSPYTDTAVAEGDKDFTKTETNHEKAGTPYNKDGKVSNKEMQSDKHHIGKSNDAYSENAQYVPDNAIANKKPTGAKAVKMNECDNNKIVKLTEEQVLVWQNSKDYMDKSNGTEIGSSAPYKECDNCGCSDGTCTCNESDDTVLHNTDTINSPTPGTSEVGDGQPYDNELNEYIIDVNDVDGMPDEEDDEEVPFPDVEYTNGDLDFEEDYNDWLNDEENDDDVDDDNDDIEFEFSDDDLEGIESFNDGYYESFNRYGFSMNEGTVLNDFGKHPAYRKVPMTTPPNKEVSKYGRDWNDSSAEGEEPFGKQIGSNAPYSEEVVNIITDAVVNMLGKKKS